MPKAYYRTEDGYLMEVSDQPLPEPDENCQEADGDLATVLLRLAKHDLFDQDGKPQFRVVNGDPVSVTEG